MVCGRDYCIGVPPTLPAPAGRWLPNARCEVYREACSYPVQDAANQEACLKHRGDCALLMYDNYEVLDRLSEPSSDHKEAAFGQLCS